MNTRDDSTIHLKKCPKGWYYCLVSDQNGQTLGMSGRYYRDPLEMIADLKTLATVGGARRFHFYQDTAGQYRFRIKAEGRVLVKSESYTQEHNCWAGFASVKKAAAAGRVTNLAADNTDILDLKDLPAAAVERRWFSDND